MLKEFRNFIARGNVLELAVAVMIGGAFNAIVTSLVNDIIMPLIGILTGGINFAGLSLQIGSALLTYGKFIQAIVNFLIIALVLFLVIRAANKFSHKEQPAPAKPPEPSAEVKLLSEIRDLLKEK
jgi:large conductance mechanosensitive channel